MKGTYSLVVFSLVIFLSGCATVETAGQIATGKTSAVCGQQSSRAGLFSGVLRKQTLMLCMGRRCEWESLPF